MERTALDGGRKLVLVRRDGVEHLILIGGPMDLVVESGIRFEGEASAGVKEETSEAIGAPSLAVAPEPPLAHPAPALETAASAELGPFSAEAGAEDGLVLSVSQEAKAAE